MPATPKPKTHRVSKTKVIKLADIVVIEGFNPRTLIEEVKLQELVASIRSRGLLEAVGVAPMPNGKYQLISGHRRHEACTRAGVTDVPVVIREGDDADRLIDAFVANRNREDLDAYDEAMVFKRMKDAGMSNRGIVDAVPDASDKLVADRLVLASLPASIGERFRLWPTSTVRTFATLCGLSGGELVAERLAVRIAESDGSVERALTSLRNAPIDALSRYAKAYPKDFPGMVDLHAAGARSGGGYKGGPRWGAYAKGDLEPAVIMPVADAALLEKLKALCSTDSKDRWSRERYRIYLDQAALDTLRAANVLFTVQGHKDQGVCLHLDSLAAVVSPIVEADHKAYLKAQSSAARAVAKGPEAQAKADEKARDMAAVNAARDFNLMLGESLAVHFSEVSLTLEHTKLICKMALLAAASGTSSMGGEGIDRLCMRGLRYVVPGWHQEVLTKSTGAISWRYPGEGTKNKTGEKTPADDNPADLFWEWWELAQTPAQVLGRTMQAIAAALHAKQEAVPASRRVMGSPFDHYSTGVNAEVRKILSALVEPKLPKPGKKPPAAAKGSAEAKARAEKAAATRAATKPKTNGAKAARKDPVAAKALTKIKADPGITVPVLAKALSVPQNQLYRVLPGMANDNKIHKQGRGWHPGPKS